MFTQCNIRSWDDDNSGEGTGEVVWVVGDGLVLSLLELGPELVKGVAIRSILDSNVVDLLEAGDVERVSITVVDVGIATTDGGVTLVVVVGVGETLASAEQSAGQLVSWQGTADGPDALDNVAINRNSISGEDSRDSWAQVVEGAKTRDGLLDGGNTVAWEVAVVGGGVETRAWATDITWTRSDILVLATDRDELVCSDDGSALMFGACGKSRIPSPSNVGHRRVPQLLSDLEMPSASCWRASRLRRSTLLRTERMFI